MKALRTCVVALAAVAAASTLGVEPSRAQYAAQLYPYCSMSSSSGATNCYVRSREECASSCIRNPWYIGEKRAWPYTHGGRPLVPHYVRP